MKTLSESVWYRTVILSVMSALPSVVSVIALGSYACLGNELTPAKVFTAMSLFSNLKHPLIVYPAVCNAVSDGLLSLKRLSAFLDAPELEPYVALEEDPRIAARITNATFSWSSEITNRLNSSDHTMQSDTLYVGDVEIKRGGLTVVVGPVGSGKTMLLHAILGNLRMTAGGGGSVSRSKGVSFVPQSPWLPHASIRNTVLFGHSEPQVDWRRYRSVLRACQMVEDLDRMEYGDCTEIGEHGGTVSGGFKQRLCLARAAYDSSRELFVFDDPLSALDVEVGRRVFQQCICGLLGRKTRVLVSNDMEVLPHADHIIVMGRGGERGGLTVVAQGSYEELRASQLLADLSGEAASSGSPVSECPILDADGLSVNETVSVVSQDACEAQVRGAATSTATSSSAQETSDTTDLPKEGSAPAEGGIDIIDDVDDSDDADLPPLTSEEAMVSLLSAEERPTGRVKMDVYYYYLRSSESLRVLVFALLSVVVSNLSIHSQQWAVAKWAMDKGYALRPLRIHLAVVLALALLSGLANCLRTWLFFQSGVTASRSIHRNMLATVLKAPLGYFETTPLGRVMLRFSRDLDQIDHQLPTIVAHLTASVVQAAAAMLSIITVTPTFGLLLPPVLCIYYLITRNFVDIASDLKHLEAVSRAPIISHFAETLDGLPVIQSFGAEAEMIRENEKRMNKNSAAAFAMKVANRWVSFRLELLGNALVFCAAMLAIFGGSSAGASGISLNNALATTGLLNWVIRNWADTQALMHSVEKVRQFQFETPQERTLAGATGNATRTQCSVQQEIRAIARNATGAVNGWMLPGDAVDEQWPWAGGILFSNVTLRYRSHLDPVLKNVNFFVRPGESVGIVGRTGSGKSSLFRGLLRLTELESGSIFIDGVDVSTVDLSVLRSRISIIPQDPVLFAGTIRSNVDPHRTMTDGELWEVLQKSHLSSLVEKLPMGLDHRVREGGALFSAGQRQLFCMARALVRKSRILLLDEATSSIDPGTDALIQDTMRSEFLAGDCTVLTVAHRLKTVLESDKILVMRDGSVAEHSTPKLLCDDKNSLFAQFIEHQHGGKNSKKISS